MTSGLATLTTGAVARPLRTRVRDSQKTRLYSAEHELHEHSSGSGWRHCASGGRLETIEEIQVYCDKVTGSAWFRRHFPGGPKHIEAQHGGGAGSARAGYRYIKMPLWSRCRLIILHEIAHCVSDHNRNRADRRDAGSHGRHYARTYLTLVTHYLGVEYGVRLKAAYKKHRVKWHPPRKPSTSFNLDGLQRYAAERKAASQNAG